MHAEAVSIDILLGLKELKESSMVSMNSGIALYV